MRFLFAVMACFLISTSLSWAKEPTLKEKIGQMLMVGFKGSELKPDDSIVKTILARKIGGVILYDYDVASQKYDKNIKNPAQVKKLTQDLQNYTQQASQLGQTEYLPLLIGVDYEGGRVNRLKENYGFPKTMTAAEAAKLPAEDLKTYAKQMAETLQTVGINFNFAPVLDVNVNPNSPAIGKLERSFSSDPQEVSRVAGVFADAFKAHGVLCAYKHFPGHGSATGDTHQGFVDVTQTWRENELVPYKMEFEKSSSCPVVMSAHVVHYGLDQKGYPATLSSAIMKDLLRKKLGFNGVIITDDMQMRAITDHYGLRDALRLTINAGTDIIMVANQLSSPEDVDTLIDYIFKDVVSGKISQHRIEEAYSRIMKLKMGLKK